MLYLPHTLFYAIVDPQQTSWERLQLIITMLRRYDLAMWKKLPSSRLVVGRICKAGLFILHQRFPFSFFFSLSLISFVHWAWRIKHGDFSGCDIYCCLSTWERFTFPRLFIYIGRVLQIYIQGRVGNTWKGIGRAWIRIWVWESGNKVGKKWCGPGADLGGIFSYVLNFSFSLAGLVRVFWSCNWLIASTSNGL